MFSNSNRVLAWVKKPSNYNLKKMMTPLQRKDILTHQLIKKPNLGANISRLNQQYKQAYEQIRKQKQFEMMKYEDSILWSPQFTPWHFKFGFIPLVLFSFFFISYIHYISQPRRMLDLKRKYGIKFPNLEPRGWLIGWLDEYRRPDSVLEFETYTIQDMEKLYKEGILTDGSQKVNKKQEEKAKRRKMKFVRGEKQFVVQNFKTT